MMRLQKKIWLAIISVLLCCIFLGTYVVAGFLKEGDLTLFRNMTSHEQEVKIQDIAEKKGPTVAWHFLKDAYVSSPGIIAGKNDPHMLAHIVGAALYKKSGIDGVTTCDQTFTMGCYHGFARALTNDKGRSALSMLQDTCQRSASEGSCVHGVGHALLGLENRDLTAALGDCDIYLKKFDFACWEGVFMEDHVVQRVSTSGVPFSSWQPCDSVPSKYRVQCAASKPGFLLASHDVASVGAFCATARTLEMETTCVRGVGFDIAHRNSGDRDAIEKACSELTDDARSICLGSAAELVVEEGYAGSKQIAAALCDKVTGAPRAGCMERLKSKNAP